MGRPLGPEQANWIGLGDALVLLQHRTNTAIEARELLIERAQLGEIAAIAHRAVGRYDQRSQDEDEWEIPCDVWQRVGEQSDNRWYRGDLVCSPDQIDVLGAMPGMDGSLRLFGVRVSAEDIDRLISSLPIDWMSAADAYAYVIKQTRWAGDSAGVTIGKRAHAGLLRSRARLFQREVRGEYGRKQLMEAGFAELPKEFWEGAMDANWATGDFSTWIEHTYQWRAFGVEFDRVEIEAMFAQADRDTDSPTEDVAISVQQLGHEPAKGRKLTHDHPYAAAMAALALADLAKSERTRLNGSSVGKEMEEHYRQRHPEGRTPHHDNLDEFGASVLDALRAHWQGKTN